MKLRQKSKIANIYERGKRNMSELLAQVLTDETKRNKVSARKIAKSSALGSIW